VEDAATFQAYRDDPEVAKYQYWASCTSDEANEFVQAQAIQAANVPGEWLQIAVESKESGAHIGDIAFQAWPSAPDTVFFGASFSKKAQGKGFAAEALSQLFFYLFERLEKRRIVGVSDCRNVPSIRLLEKLGFRREGHFIENLYFKSEWVSEYQYALLKSEWPHSPAYQIYQQTR
jgi:RimJ/RimL family protein N-acetyltransferase